MAKSKEQEIPEGYKQTEIGVIPIDWDIMRLGEAVDVVGGGTPSTANPKYWNGSINWFTPTEVGNEKYAYESKRKISDEGLKNSSAKILNEGTVLLTSRAGIGDLAILKARACTNQGFQSLVPKDQTDGEFLYYLMLTKKSDLLDKASGSTFLEISPNNVRNILIQLPKTSEQTVIAAVLSDTDELIEKLNKLIEKKKNIKQGAMQELLTGRRRLPGFEIDHGFKETDIGLIPKDWDLVTYDQAFSFLRTASYSRDKLNASGQCLYVHYGDIHTRWNYFLDISANELPSINEKMTGNYSFIKNGDLIIADASEDYEGIAKCVEVKNLGTKKAISGLHTFLLRDKNNFFSDGFKGYITSNMLVKRSIDRLTTGLKVYGISKNNLKSILIPRPSIREQKAITNALSDMGSEIEQLQSQLEKYKNIKQGMMQNLLTGKIRLIKK